MKVATFYADAILPEVAARKSAGFDWHRAINDLERSARASLSAETVVFTDRHTQHARDCIRVGDAKAEGVILWLLDAQAAAIRAFDKPFLMASPDTLLAGPLDMLFGDWDVCLLTRERPKAIVNSVIAVRPCEALSRLWERAARDARSLPPDARAWGADLDVIITTFGILPGENSIRTVDGVRVRLMPIDGIFTSVNPKRMGMRPPHPVWDFKGARKAMMSKYAELIAA